MKFTFFSLIVLSVLSGAWSQNFALPNYTQDSKDYKVNGRACNIFIGIDQSLLIKHNSSLRAVVELARDHVDALNRIYTSQVFKDNRYFRLTRVQVMSYKSYAWFWNWARRGSNFSVDYLAMFTGSNDFSKFCLAFLFTNENLHNVLGSSIKGGICDSEGSNTGFVSFFEEAEKHSIQTFAHEVAHSFGAGHDEVGHGCRDSGNIMSEDINILNGDQEMFSNCSVRKLRVKLRHMKSHGRDCFITARRSYTHPRIDVSNCGNGILEPGEECDCGMESSMCNDWCYPDNISMWDIVFSSSDIILSCHFKNDFGFLFLSVFIWIFVLIACLLLGLCLYCKCCRKVQTDT
jgi:hypothetical protein